MLRKILLVGFLAVALLTATAVFAITNGQPDGGEHPYVGLLYAFVSPEVGGYICSGTLMSPTVFLTAAHCLDVPAVEYRVTFSERPFEQGFNWILGTAIPHPGFGDFTLPNTYDIGVVILSQPVTMPTYGALPAAGLLDTVAVQRGLRNVAFEAVGYGLQNSQPIQSQRPIEEWDLARYKGDQQLIEISSALTGGYNVKLTNNPGQGNGSGGTCSGDSGGPILQRDTNVVVAINSFGIAPYCRGNDYAYRVDTNVAREFLSQWLTLP